MDNRKYNLYWMVNGNIRETILNNVQYVIAKSKKHSLEKTTHKSGILLIKRSHLDINKLVF